jgi:hypothetical protein
MAALRSWSFARVLLVSVAWIIVCVLVFVAWIVFQLRGPLIGPSGSGGVGAVSVGINELILAIPVVPPILLVLAWLIARVRGNSPQAV